MKYNCGIYKIENLVTGDFYIGQSVNLKSRKYQHFYDLRNKKHCNKYFQNSFNKHGSENFRFSVLIFCDKNNLTLYEQLFVDKLNPKFNLCLVCVDSVKGVRFNKTLRMIKTICKKTNKIYKLKCHRNKDWEEMADLLHSGKTCTFQPEKKDMKNKDDDVCIIPKTLNRGKYVWNYKNNEIASEKEFYFRYLACLKFYSDKLENRRSNIDFKPFLKMKHYKRVYDNLRLRPRFWDDVKKINRLSDEKMNKIFKGVSIISQKNRILIYVEKKSFKKLYITYF